MNSAPLHGASRAPSYDSLVPISLANLFRAGVLLLLALHVFYMYCTARAGAETFGFHLGTTVVAALFSLAMLVPLVWAVTLPELPEIYTTHWRPRRRWKRGQCPSCGYPFQGLPDGLCPECGARLEAPTGYRIRARTIKLFVAMNLLAWLIGCIAGEMWVEMDERAFIKEAKSATAHAPWDWEQDLYYTRERRWPNRSNSLYYSRAKGVLSKPDAPVFLHSEGFPF